MQGPTDFYDDLNGRQRFYSISRLFEMPTFVKEAMDDPETVKTLPVDAFADPRSRKFPCHTKAAVWLSQAYFLYSKGKYDTGKADEIQVRLRKAAEYFQISPACEDFVAQWNKAAGTDDDRDLPDSAFGLVVEAEGNKRRLFPMPNAASVKAAGEYLFSNRFKYPYPWRKQAARNILAAAIRWDEKAKKGEDVPGDYGSLRFEPDTLSYLEKASGFASSFPGHVAEKIAQRVLMIDNRKHGDVRVKLAELAVVTAQISPKRVTAELLEKIAEAVDVVDRETGIYRQYANGVDLPEESFFQLLEKDAQAVIDGFVTLSTGNTYPVAAFDCIPLDKAAEIMGTEFKDAVSGLDGSVDPKKLAEVAPTLPRGDAQLLERLLEETAATETRKASLRQERTSGNDPFSEENMCAYFTNRGLKPKNLRFSMAIPMGKTGK